MMAMVFVWTLGSVCQAIFLGIILICGIILGLLYSFSRFYDWWRFRKILKNGIIKKVKK